MSIQQELDALLRSGMLTPGQEPEALLWGEISGGRLDVRPGILYLVDATWGFFGRDFEFLTNYSGFAAEISSIEQIRGPLPFDLGMEGYEVQGIIESEGFQQYTFLPDTGLYRRNPQEVQGFFEELRRRVHNQVHPDAQGPMEQAQWCLQRGETQQAIQLFWQAYHVDSRSAQPPYWLGRIQIESDPNAAVRFLREAEERGYSDLDELYLWLAKAHFANEDPRQAEQYVRQLLRTGETPELLFLLADIEAARGRDLEALQALKRAATLAPRDPDIQSLLAYHAVKFGEPDLAEQALRRLESVGGQHATASLARALLAKESDDEYRAMHFLKEALELDPMLPPAQVLMVEWGGTPREPTRLDASLRHLNPADLTLEEIERREGSFTTEDIPAALHDLEEFLARFLAEWSTQWSLCPDDPDERQHMQTTMEASLIQGLTTKLEEISQPLGQGMKRDIDEFALALPLDNRPAFVARSEGLSRELNYALQQLTAYAEGTIAGGSFRTFVQQVQQSFPSLEQDERTALLQTHLEPLPTRLEHILQQWKSEVFAQLAIWLDPWLEEDEMHEFDATGAPYEPPAPTSLRNFDVPEEDEEDEVPLHQPEATRIAPTEAPANTSMTRWAAKAPANVSLRKAKVRQREYDPVDGIYQKYMAAFTFIGIEPPTLDKNYFLQQIRAQLQNWVGQTGREPELYIRIEQGKPQVKIRER